MPKLYGSRLLKAVAENRDKDWKKIIDVCGYKRSRNRIRNSEGWINYKVGEVRVYYMYREFYTNYILAAWKDLSYQFQTKYGKNKEFKDGLEQLADFVPELFAAGIKSRDSHFLAPSFWDIPHGRSALMLMNLGGFKMVKKQKYMHVRFQDKSLHKLLVDAGLTTERLDYLQEIGSNEYSEGLRALLKEEEEDIPKKHWTIVFKEKYPLLNNAILGQELVEKNESLFKKQVTKNQICYECGFFDPQSKKKNPNYGAFNFALRCSQSKEEIFFAEDGSRIREKLDASDLPPSSPHAFQAPKSQEIPEWLKDEAEDESNEELYDGQNIYANNLQGLPRPQNSESISKRERLTGSVLLNFAIKCSQNNIPETSICIRSGYDTDEIGKFRRAFSKAANVMFAPLTRMLYELNSNKIHSLKSLAENNWSDDKLIEDKAIIDVLNSSRKRSSSLRSQAISFHGSCCAICSMDHEEILEAAHIIPVSEGGADIPTNTLILCANHHSAFDKHLFAFDPISKELILKRGISTSSLQITKTILTSNISSEALRIREQLFNSYNQS